ncbi:glutathione ABC transporter substrate-binding protein [Spirochaeta africana]|uniref:ABC-type dipeptide transport system, periplasmic component n=1 Tax=Spirochaeta africana (strain ATCC 700263 / DSM 8902 / Z-7692) TaxID=889378 RepID=H9UGG0_SPIAZ|nr:glutathione ABC transporter substrate-binding protein [Spirochaeta africana]AFG36603.1 ABC-type dipeptide transport system, periplasmic component [Spirochaeta africana DSM 8902]
MRKGILIALLGALVAVLIIGCGADQTGDAKPQNTDVLVVVSPADARSLDPQATNDQASARVMNQIYETLMYQTEDLEVELGLVSDYTVESETEYLFTLREGVMFHNGEELTADDVKFTFERMREVNSPAAFLVAALDRVEVIDDYTFRMILDFPFGPFITHLGHPATAILNRTAVEAGGEDYGRNPVGTGPFKFVQWRSGDSITLERFEDYRLGPAASREVRFRFISEDTNRAIALETGEADIIYDVGPNDFDNLVEMDSIDAIQSEGLTTFYMGFNVEKEPFDDVRVRRAINLAVDVETATDVAFRGYATAARGPLAPNVLFANNDLPGYGYDPDQARELLAEAGYADGFRTSIWTNDNPVRIRYAEIFQEQLAQVGIDLNIEIMEFAPYLDRTAQGEHDMFMLGWVAVTGDADYGLYSLFHSSEFGDAGNRTFWANDEVDRLLDLGKTDPDPEVRRDAYYRAQEIIFEEAPWVFLAFRDELNATRNWVEGFVPHTAGHHKLYQVFNN